MKSLAQLFTGFGSLAAQAVEDALMLGVSLGQDIAQIASSVEQALMQPLYRALTVASDWLVSAFRGGVSDTVQGSGMSGWVWICQLGSACAMCTAMHGTVHGMDETLDSHLKCYCQQQFFSGEAPDMQLGQDWFAEQDDETKLEVLGSNAALAALNDDAVTLSDFIGIADDPEYGMSRYQRSLKEILGKKQAQQYYS